MRKSGAKSYYRVHRKICTKPSAIKKQTSARLLMKFHSAQGERLSNAVGYAFALYFERKKKSDKNCAVTMNFDLTSATFTRVGSFKRQSLTETLRDKTNSTHSERAPGAEDLNGTSHPPTTIININNNITTDFEENKGKKRPSECCTPLKPPMHICCDSRNSEERLTLPPPTRIVPRFPFSSPGSARLKCGGLSCSSSNCSLEPKLIVFVRMKDGGPFGKTHTNRDDSIYLHNNYNIFDSVAENIPCRAYDRARTACDFERSLHSVSAALRRQRSLRELPRLGHSNETSPFFRRHASLRLRELPSNVERVKSLSAEFAFDTRTSSSAHFSRYHTPVSPIAEMSPANTPDKMTPNTRSVGIGYESAARQQLAQKFEPAPQAKFESNQVRASGALRKHAFVSSARSAHDRVIFNSTGVDQIDGDRPTQSGSEHE